MEYPDYYPVQPYTLISDAPADRESGHEFILHFDIEEERYYVFFFAEERHAIDLHDEYERVTGRRAMVIHFDARNIEERFGVRYTDSEGKQTDMSLDQYLRNREIKNEFRRDD